MLKTADAKYIQRDFSIFCAIIGKGRHRDFAKTYWATKYCILQKYGKKRKVPQFGTDRGSKRKLESGTLVMFARTISDLWKDGSRLLMPADANKRRTGHTTQWATQFLVAAELTRLGVLSVEAPPGHGVVEMKKMFKDMGKASFSRKVAGMRFPGMLK